MQKSLASKIVARRLNKAAQVPEPETEQVPFGDVPLVVGTKLQMKLAGAQEDAERHAVELYGAIRGRSLIISLPSRDGAVLWLQPNEVYYFHFLKGTRVYGFTANVQHVRAEPFPYAHVSWPASAQAKQVRNSNRITLNTPVEIAPPGARPGPAMLQDLSMTGCGIATTLPIKANDAIAIHLPVSLMQMKTALVLPGIVRNRQDREGKYPYYGVQFGELKTSDAMLLHHYIEHLTAQSAR